MAGDQRTARGGRQQRREHADGGGLAGAVGPEQPEHLAGGDREGDAADGQRLRSARRGRRRARLGRAESFVACVPPAARGEGPLTAVSRRSSRARVAERWRRRARPARASCAARACASRRARARGCASSPARLRTSSSWRSRWPSASLSSCGGEPDRRPRDAAARAPQRAPPPPPAASSAPRA